MVFKYFGNILKFEKFDINIQKTSLKTGRLTLDISLP